MGEGFRHKLAAFDEQGALQGLDVDRVRVYTHDARIEAVFTADKLLPPDRAEQVAAVLSRAFKARDVKATITAYSVWESFTANPEKHAAVFAEHVAQKLPSAQIWLKDSKWARRGGKIIIDVPNTAGAAYLNDNGACGEMSAMARHLFGQEAQFEIISREDVEESEKRWVMSRDAELEKRGEEALAEAKLREGKKRGQRRRPAPGAVILGSAITERPTPMSELGEAYGRAVVCGKAVAYEMRVISGRFTKLSLSLYDRTESVKVKLLLNDEDAGRLDEVLSGSAKRGDWLAVRGSFALDRYENNAPVLTATDINMAQDPNPRMDNAEQKRVELHLHTKMSAMDGFVEVGALIKRAADWGHSAVAVTDHGVVHSLPEAYFAAKKAGIKLIMGVEGYLIGDERSLGESDARQTYHIILLAANRTGVNNLYTLISKSHLDHFHRHPRIPRELLEAHRDGVIVGSACEAGELYQAILNGRDDEALRSIAEFYDYLEIQPDGNNMFLVRSGKFESVEALHGINKKIVSIGKQLGKDVVATGDVHFLEPEDECFRRIIMSGQGFQDADIQAPLYYKTTEEMLEEFAYLGEEGAMDAVVLAPHRVADRIEDTSPLAKGLFVPQLENSEERVRTMTLEGARRAYGDPLPLIVQARLDKEMGAILKFGYSPLYLSAQMLVKKSLEDGYLVGSRGSIGSSLVATMIGISEINPLPSHYHCLGCGFSDFDVDHDTYQIGPDLPKRDCPSCGTPLERDGYNTPFEVFLGFNGEKTPDIDLNFSGDYQATAHKYTEVIFGPENVFKAGTVGTLADRTNYGFVKKYFEAKNQIASDAEINRLVAGCSGVKRSTGQHPGGIVVLPKGMDINTITPVQHPADDKDKGIITTHFNYHDIESNLVKLDILGHDTPTQIRLLQDMTGVDPMTIDISDKQVLSLFSSTESLGVTSEQINCPVGTFGIPEFGTNFVRQVLVDTLPTTVEELVRISGLSHGTDVWLGNAQDLVRDGIVPLAGCICSREDIINYLSNKLEPLDAFLIMENVRKGNGLTLKDGRDSEALMRNAKVPEWFIESCKKIKYLFPKGHAAAYVMMSLKIAYFKVYYPAAFYAVYLSMNIDSFDSRTMMGNNVSDIIMQMEAIERKGRDATKKEEDTYSVMAVVREMLQRGVRFLPMDIYKSPAARFALEDGSIRPPLRAFAGLGEKAARGIVAAREECEFLSIEDLRERSRISRTLVDIMRESGCLDGLSETSQLSLFG